MGGTETFYQGNQANPNESGLTRGMYNLCKMELNDDEISGL